MTFHRSTQEWWNDGMSFYMPWKWFSGPQRGRQRQLLPSSLGTLDATSKATFPGWQTEARQHKRNKDVASDVCFSCSCLGSQHPSPNVKTFWKFEPQIWLEFITSRDAKSACFKGSRTSCREIIFGIFWPNFGQTSCRLLPLGWCWFRERRRFGARTAADPGKLQRFSAIHF